jgi:hypothetical protein
MSDPQDDNLAECRISTKPLLVAGRMSHPAYEDSKIHMFNLNSIPEIAALPKR